MLSRSEWTHINIVRKLWLDLIENLLNLTMCSSAINYLADWGFSVFLWWVNELDPTLLKTGNSCAQYAKSFTSTCRTLNQGTLLQFYTLNNTFDHLNLAIVRRCKRKKNLCLVICNSHYRLSCLTSISDSSDGGFLEMPILSDFGFSHRFV